MTQLSEDCFAHGGALMPLDEALALIEKRVSPISGFETIPLFSACGRILASDMIASNDVPPHANSAVDGYVVYYDDLSLGPDTVLPLIGRIAAGQPFHRPVRRGEAVRIFTGAMMPVGEGDDAPDTVFMQEDCQLDGTRVTFPSGIDRGANRRLAGEDVAIGDMVLAGGRRLRAADLALAAAMGHTELVVRNRLRVALFSTGDEVREPGASLAPGQIYDSNRVALRALLTSLGCVVSDLGILADDPKKTAVAITESARTHDLLISSGGVSVGEEDHVRDVVEGQGRIDIWRLAIKPGRPLILGMVRTDICPVPYLGLPGNPAAVIVTFLKFARPLILCLAGAKEPPPRLYPVRAGFSHKKKKQRREYVRCVLSADTNGGFVAKKAGRQGAGILSAVSSADGLVELPEDMKYLKYGSTVDFMPFDEVE